VEPGGIRHPDIDPGPQRARQIADRDRRIIGIAKSSRKLDAVGEFEAIGEHAGDQIFFRLGRVARHPQRQRFVDVTVGVGELDVEVVNGGGLCHYRYPLRDPRSAARCPLSAIRCPRSVSRR
jgi:hypothetical protein